MAKTGSEGGDAAQKRVFDRNEDVCRLLEILQFEPKTPIVVVGPKDSGKSMLLRHVEGICKKEVPVFLLDLGSSAFLTPDAFAREFQSRLTAWLDELFELLDKVDEVDVGPFRKCKFVPAKVWTSFRKCLEQPMQLSELVSRFSLFVQQVPSLGPIFIVDKADCLRAWETGFLEELRVLIEFFTWLTKQQRLARVVLSSSDNFFLSWLRDQGKLQYRVFGLGNFNEDEAKQFFEKHCFVDISPKEPWLEKWSEIFRVTGGSPIQLELVAEAGATVPWDDAVESLVLDAIDVLENILAKFDKKDRNFAYKAMKLVVDRNGIVPMKSMDMVVDNTDAVFRMVKAGMFHVRYCTPLIRYKDIDVGGIHGNYVMPFRPPYLAAMKRLVQEAPLCYFVVPY